MKNKVYLTKTGLKSLKKELNHLTTVKRVEIAKVIEDALGVDGPDDNFEYDRAREEQMLLEKRILELTEAMKEVELIRVQRSSDEVCLGSTVVVELEKEKMELTIVGSMEADPMSGKISNESPLGEVLVGSVLGAEVTVENEGGRLIYRIIKIK